MISNQQRTASREWDESIMEEGQPASRYGIYNCINCLDYGDNDGEPCPYCNKSGDRTEREYQTYLEERC